MSTFKPGDRVIFRPTDSDRKGKVLTDVIVRLLTDKEADAEVGPMYHLAENGDAFEDELQKNPMHFPTLHLNGSGFENLSRDYCEVHHALRKAIAAMRQAYPHERDYYIKPEINFREVQEQHADRIRRVQVVADEIEAILMDIHRQKDGKA